MVLSLKDISLTYKIAGRKKTILDNISLDVASGKVISITGKSGCGKTSLLNVIATLVKPNNGDVFVDGERINYFLDLMPARTRRSKIGYIFQTFRLIHRETLLDNVLLPLRIIGDLDKGAVERAEYLLERVKLYAHRNRKTGELSGGMQQRVAIARALINDPAILCADEPDANLDPETAEEIFSLLIDECAHSRALIIVTHNPGMHVRSDRVLLLENGLLMETD